MTVTMSIGGRVGATAGLVVGAVIGLMVGTVIGVVTGAAVARAPAWVPAAAIRRRQRHENARLLARLPVGLDLMAACLEVGAPPTRCLATVAEALGGPVGDEFAIVAHSLWLGASPAEACRRLLADHGPQASPPLQALARALGRADESGSRLAQSLRAIADSERAAAHHRAVEDARRVGVYAVAPLGLCFLPAFILLGVTPIVAGTIGQLTF